MRLYNDIVKFLDSIEDDFHYKKWGSFILKILLSCLVIVCMAWTIAQLILIIYYNIDYIIIVVGGLACFIAFIRSLMPKRKTEPKRENVPVQNNMKQVQFDPVILENNYESIKEGIFLCLLELPDDIKIKKPDFHNQIDAPVHYDIVVNTPIYHFYIMKNGESDIGKIQEFLQKIIERKLNNHEFSNISNSTFIYNGQIYPALMIDKVLNVGQHIRVDISVVNPYYCQYRQQRMMNNLMDTSSANISDYEF